MLDWTRPPAPVGGSTQTSKCFISSSLVTCCGSIVSPKLAFLNILGVFWRARRKTDATATVATRHGLVVVVLVSLERLDPRTICRPRCSNLLHFPSSTFLTFTISSTIVPANDFLKELPTRKECMVVGRFHRSPMPL